MYKLRICFECILDLDLIFALNATFFCEIMDDERFLIWIRFMMDDEMTMIIIPALEKGFSSPMILAPQLMQFSIVKWCHQKEKKMMKQMLKGDEMILLLLTSLIYMKKSGGILFGIQALNTYWHQTTLFLAIFLSCLVK